MYICQVSESFKCTSMFKFRLYFEHDQTAIIVKKVFKMGIFFTTLLSLFRDLASWSLCKFSSWSEVEYKICKSGIKCNFWWCTPVPVACVRPEGNAILCTWSTWCRSENIIKRGNHISLRKLCVLWLQPCTWISETVLVATSNFRNTHLPNWLGNDAGKISSAMSFERIDRQVLLNNRTNEP